MRVKKSPKLKKAKPTMSKTESIVNQWLSQRVPGAMLDASGIAIIRRDGDTAIVLEVPAGSEVCHLCALVAPLPEVAREAALLAALELNRFGRPLGGCWLAWEDEVQMLTLCHNLLVPVTDATGFGNTLDNFLVALDYARGHLLARSSDGGMDTDADEYALLSGGVQSGAATYRAPLDQRV